MRHFEVLQLNVQQNLLMMEPQVTIFVVVVVAGRSHFIQVLKVWIRTTQDSRDCKSFLLKTGF